MHGVKCGLQILTSGFVLTLNLFDVPIELALHSTDLLLNQIGTLLQIATYVTQLMIPPTFNPRRSNDQAGEQFRLIPSESSIAKRRDFSATHLLRLLSHRAAKFVLRSDRVITAEKQIGPRPGAAWASRRKASFPLFFLAIHVVELEP